MGWEGGEGGYRLGGGRIRRKSSVKMMVLFKGLSRCMIQWVESGVWCVVDWKEGGKKVTTGEVAVHCGTNVSRWLMSSTVVPSPYFSPLPVSPRPPITPTSTHRHRTGHG